jgi:hypothetical protein
MTAAMLEAVGAVVGRGLRERPIATRDEVIGAADAARVRGGFEHRQTGRHAGGEPGHARSEDESPLAHGDPCRAFPPARA